MNEIIPNLWLGSYPSLKVLQKNPNNIQSILSIMMGKVKVPDTFVHHQVPLNDTDDADILSYFLASIEFIQAELDQGRRVLVHCHAGISRSPTIVAAYLMYSRKIDRDAALAIIQVARPFISPNWGFMAQLDKFYQTSYKAPPGVKNTRTSSVKRKSKIADDACVSPETMTFAPHPPDLPDLATSAKGMRRIRCRMCRQELATREHLVRHGQSSSASILPSTSPLPNVTPESPTALPPVDATESAPPPPDMDARAAGSTVVTTSSVISIHNFHTSPPPTDSSTLINQCCSGYFLEQMAWMEFLDQGLLAGKIVCPNKKCNAKLGNYDWTGVRCGCQEWITPGFCISRSKVDEIIARL